MLKKKSTLILVPLTICILLLLSSAVFARTWPLVKQGDNGRNVVTVQYLLKYRGYSLSVDGDFGPTTKQKVQSFQSANGLTSDGIVGAQTWEKLVVTVKQGDNGYHVRAVQDQLKNRYGYNITVDGAFGSGTDQAVRSFQSSKGLSSDGIVGLNTWAVLVGGSTGSGGSSDKLTHAEAMQMLNGTGISVTSSGNCSNRYNSTCTSLEQIRRNSMDGIINFKNACGCTVIITGGTETGHSSGTYSHWNGYKIDINSGYSSTNNYITTNYTFIGYRGDGAATYQDGNGNKFYRESNHWDILFQYDVP